MPCYSFKQLQQDWIYACGQDFTSADGKPATWAPGQPAFWGDEQAKIPLSTEPASASLSADGNLLALALEHDIHVYSVKALELDQVLKGHVSRVDAIRFHPQTPNVLVSCAMNYHAESIRAEPVIIFWDLDEQRTRTLGANVTIQDIARQAVRGVVSGFQDSQSTWVPNDEEQTDMARDIEKLIETMTIKGLVRDNRQIFGRLCHSFGSHVFNQDGASMAYMPKSRPESNSIDKWDICIWDTLKGETKFTLEGHTDAIMWIGFSPDDKLIGSVCWDNTFRIWSHETGDLVRTFRSNHQNWTGGFSPDSRYFAGTSGDGRFWVWDMTDGSELVTHKLGVNGMWYRTLDWSPDGTQLILGGQRLGHLVVFNVQDKCIVQERMLSTKNVSEELHRLFAHSLEVTLARYLSGGRRIAFCTTSDNGVEVYDFIDNTKWRFAPRPGENRGFSDFVLLPKAGLIASVHADAIRLWALPPSDGD